MARRSIQPLRRSAAPSESFDFGATSTANTASGEKKFTFSFASPSTSAFGQPTNASLFPSTVAQSTGLSQNASTTLGTLTSTPGGFGKTGKTILPSKILASQICSECCNYLSVGPVKVDQGKKICGRCIKQDYTEKALSLYDKIAECCIFKCINHYSGCKEVFAYNEAIDHEKTCKKEDLKCPYCDFKGNGCQLVHHFKEKHPKSIAENNAFPILLESGSRSFIFAENDDLLYVTISISDKSINVSNLLAYDDNSYVKCFKIILFNPSCCMQYVTPVIQANTNQDLYNQQGNSFQVIKEAVMSCFPSGQCLVEVKFLCCDKELSLSQRKDDGLAVKTTEYMQESTIAGQFRQNVTKTELLFDRISKMNNAELQQFVLTEWKKLQECVNCGKCLIDKNYIYFCRKHHLACETCSSKKCRKCSAFTQWNKVKFDFLSVQCDWEGCDKSVTIFEFLLHKQRCPHRQYRCPGDNCQYVACLEDFRKHWHLTPYLDCSMVKISDDCAFYCFITFSCEFIYITAEITADKITIHLNEEQIVLCDSYGLQLFYKPPNPSLSYPNGGSRAWSAKSDESETLQKIEYKWEYSQFERARTLSAQNPTKSVSDHFYLKFYKKVDYNVAIDRVTKSAETKPKFP